MIDLDEGERLVAEGLTVATLRTAVQIQHEWHGWCDANAPALIAELREARERIATLKGLLLAHGIEEGP